MILQPLTSPSAYGAITSTAIGLFVGYHGQRLVKTNVPAMRNAYMYCNAFILTVWACYGIVWGLCEGGNVLSPDVETILYGLLDLAGGPVFCCFFVLAGTRY